MNEISGLILFATGVVFDLLGCIGLVRLPDVYNRIQAGTKATTLGTLLSLAGVACLQPDWTLKLLLIGVFILFTNPLSSQVLARAAHHQCLAVTLPALFLHRDALAPGEIRSGVRRRVHQNLVQRPLRHDFSAVYARSGSQIDHKIRGFDGFPVMFHHNHRIPQSF